LGKFTEEEKNPVLQKYSIPLHQMLKQKRLIESLKHSGQEKTHFHISHQSWADFVMGGLRMSLIQLS